MLTSSWSTSSRPTRHPTRLHFTAGRHAGQATLRRPEPAKPSLPCMHMQPELRTTLVLREDAYKVDAVHEIGGGPAASTCSPVQVKVTIFCPGVVSVISPIWQGRRCSVHGSIVPISKVIHHRAAFVHAASPACGRAASQQQHAAMSCMARLHEPECQPTAWQSLSCCWSPLMEVVRRTQHKQRQLLLQGASLLTCTKLPGLGGRPTGQSSRRCRGTVALCWHQMQWTVTGSLANGTGQAHERCTLWVWGWQS